MVHCHLCALWVSLFGGEPQPLAREARECANCRGDGGVRGTVRRAVAAANGLLSSALIQVEEPIPLENT